MKQCKARIWKQCNVRTWDKFVSLINESIQVAYRIRIDTDNAEAFNAFQDSVSKCVKDFHDEVFGMNDDGRCE